MDRQNRPRTGLLLAQSPAEHEGHHPDQKEAPVAKPAAPPEPQRGTGPSQGMMGGGMMNMMGGNMQMPDMIHDGHENAGRQAA